MFILLQAAGIAQGSMEDQLMPQAEQESCQHTPMPAQMPETGMHTAPGMQPQGQPSSFGMAEAGRGGAPQPTTAEQTTAEQGVAGRDVEAEMQEANPFRSGSTPASATACPAWAHLHQVPHISCIVLQVNFCAEALALAGNFLINRSTKYV